MKDDLLAVLFFAIFCFAICDVKNDLPTSNDKGPSSVMLIKDCDSLIVLTDVLTYVPANVVFEIKDFRPFVQDIVKSYYKHPDDLDKDAYTFSGRGFSLWISNGYFSFRLYEPKSIEFTEDEKQYLWRMYENWMPNVKIKY